MLSNLALTDLPEINKQHCKPSDPNASETMVHAVSHAVLAKCNAPRLRKPSLGRVCSGVNAMLRKVAVAAASTPQVEIRQDGEQFYIKTSTSVRTTEINFRIGEEFNEETVDGRKVKVGQRNLFSLGLRI